ncbi:hypothetical protein A5651_11660 [Mycobacterium sp. 1274761.0]|nr:hypothetical protein A5651_11660 [Mycobacterium sp. 1274761.0]
MWVVTTAWSTACSNTMQNQHIDISGIFAVKSTFGPEYKVVTNGPTGIDPRLFAPQKLPANMTIDPAECSKYAQGQTLPSGLTGRMATVTAEGDNNRFVAVAVQTSAQVPYESISHACNHIAFTGQSVRGAIDVVDAPHILGAETLAIHRTLEATLGGLDRSGELYNYTAYLGNSVVLVVVNPVKVPNGPPAVVDVEKARRLLSDSVAAVRGHRF